MACFIDPKERQTNDPIERIEIDDLENMPSGRQLRNCLNFECRLMAVPITLFDACDPVPHPVPVEGSDAHLARDPYSDQFESELFTLEDRLREDFDELAYCPLMDKVRYTILTS